MMFISTLPVVFVSLLAVVAVQVARAVMFALNSS